MRAKLDVIYMSYSLNIDDIFDSILQLYHLRTDRKELSEQKETLLKNYIYNNIQICRKSYYFKLVLFVFQMK